ncbi:hypothetical protein K431DRAFT_138416 [Polychaeton citri CBS 116435]|uniref:Uncharacterized protein n=1 Tax=Polychaeton citri CBS 116435 TaxID=1314669 RepID=A0A9P4ULX8_9PEZI|nr:hypothetical protein K431DRAFT_138416 [Polychaeton citri CBS 116435]
MRRSATTYIAPQAPGRNHLPRPPKVHMYRMFLVAATRDPVMLSSRTQLPRRVCHLLPPCQKCKGSPCLACASWETYTPSPLDAPHPLRRRSSVEQGAARRTGQPWPAPHHHVASSQKDVQRRTGSTQSRWRLWHSCRHAFACSVHLGDFAPDATHTDVQ